MAIEPIDIQINIANTFSVSKDAHTAQHRATDNVVYLDSELKKDDEKELHDVNSIAKDDLTKINPDKENEQENTREQEKNADDKYTKVNKEDDDPENLQIVDETVGNYIDTAR